jgi:N utilization substance protein B
MIAMQTLFEYDFRDGADVEEIKSRNINEYNDATDSEFVVKLVDGTLKSTESIDEEIKAAAPEWPLDQISLIDKSILRLAIYELKYENDVPAKVVINEAVELGKQFGGENSSKFINGVLGTVYEKITSGDNKKSDDN